MQKIRNKLLLPTDIYRESERRLGELRKCEQQIMKALETAPKGKIRVAKTGKRIQYYLRENSSDTCGKYISKSSETRISALLQKRYNEYILKILQQEIASIDSFLRESKISNSRMKMICGMKTIENHTVVPELIQSAFSGLPDEMKSYITPIDMSDRDYVKQWVSKPFISKELGECNSVQVTENGENVRSKSELNIANALRKYNIPYRYECKLLLNGKYYIYPDFTVLDVRNRQEVYWEHRGMMDDRDYAKHSVGRIKDYQADGIFLGDRLIITEETATQTLSTREIEAIIKHYFL